MAKRIFFSLAVGLIVAMMAAAAWDLAQVGQQRAELEESVLRLHIVAQSDDPADQAVKLAVRDAVVEQYGQQLAQAESREQAQEIAQTLLPAMLDTAKQTAARQGSLVPVTGEVGKFSFPAVSYEGYTLPAGEYQAVRIQLGEGAGHNWFCVLYPAVCLDSSTVLDQGMTSRQSDMLTHPEDYEIRFALLDGLMALWNWVTGG